MKQIVVIDIIAIFLIGMLTVVIAASAQIFPKENTQTTDPSNKTAIDIIFNHGEGNYTISDLMPTSMENKCPIVGHIIDNNNITGIQNLSDTLKLTPKPFMLCYI